LSRAAVPPRESGRVDAPATRFVEHEGVNIAWQVFGAGPAEILFVPGWVSNLDLFWQFPQPGEFFYELAGFARVAMYDKPGTGLSDPVDEVPTAEVRVEQLMKVMDGAGLESPTVVGVCGAPALGSTEKLARLGDVGWSAGCGITPRSSRTACSAMTDA
jgi:hypothetical protein